MPSTQISESVSINMRAKATQRDLIDQTVVSSAKMAIIWNSVFVPKTWG
ncbi:hypothetical protein [Crenothrix polyspora]|uniref:Uncharacterized protein n=1 Tax=Crenothrix polyspora TaxID=360316 RepID=A0A1R4HAV7_9GAMM|nr:hypothetical protein [Crenothrix polyspora]SJM93353.1 hypothetical protein CRENPOLYSF1_430052 [Crenothrix polyspora]